MIFMGHCVSCGGYLFLGESSCPDCSFGGTTEMMPDGTGRSADAPITFADVDAGCVRGARIKVQDGEVRAELPRQQVLQLGAAGSGFQEMAEGIWGQEVHPDEAESLRRNGIVTGKNPVRTLAAKARDIVKRIIESGVNPAALPRYAGTRNDEAALTIHIKRLEALEMALIDYEDGRRADW